jgi:PAS domain S-box-containing protein
MNKNAINVLLIEDNPRDVGLIEKMLLTAKVMAFNLTHATTLADGLAQLTSKNIDAILLDLKLADSEGLDTLTQVQGHALEIPIVVLTGLDDEASGLKAVQQGAQDYLIKDEVSGPLLRRAIRYAIERQRMAKTLQRHMDHLEDTVAARTDELRQTNAHLQREIAERERTERALRARTRALQESETRFNLFIEHLPAAISIKDTEERVVYANRHFANVIGCKPEELVGLTSEAITPPALLDQYHRENQRALEGETVKSESVFPGGDGPRHWLTYKFPIYRNGQPAFVGAISLDITERKRAQQALQRSEARFRGVFEQAAVGIAIVSPNETIIEVNQKLCAMLGYTKEELLTLTVQDITHPEDFEREQRYVLEVLADEREDFNIQKRYVHKQGYSVWVNLSSNVIRDEDGTIQFVIGVVVDITAQKRAEETLQAREALYRSLVETAPDSIILTNLEGEILFCNQQTALMYGYPCAEDMMGCNVFDLIDTEDQERAWANTTRVLAGETIRFAEYTVLKRDGTQFWVALNASLVSDAQGNPQAFIGVTRDITTRKQMEKELKRLAAVVQMAPDAIAVTDLEAKVIYANPAMARLRGFDHEADVYGTNALDWFASPDKARAAMEEIVAQGNISNREFVGLTQQGEPVPIAVSATLLKNTEGKPTGFAALIRDITDSKRMQEALRESEARYRSLFTNNHAVMLLIDPDSGAIIDANPAACTYYGYSHKALTARAISDINMLSEAEVYEEMQRAKHEARRHFLFHHRLASGAVRDVEVYSGPIHAYGKQLLYSIVHDITERKRIEEALRESEARLRRLVENMPVMMDAFDEDNRILVWNRECERVTGYSADEMVGNAHAMEILYPDTAYRERMMAEMVKLENDFRDEEWAITCKDGTAKTISWSNISARFPIPGWNMWAIGVDVTARKQAEQSHQRYAAALERSNAEFKQFAHIVSHDLKAPLRMVKSFLELLSRHYGYDLDAEAHEYIQFAMDGATQMEQLIDALLAYARVDSQGQDPIPTDAEEILDIVLHILQFDIQEKSAEVTHTPLPTVRADPTQLKQLFQNLIGNALKFCDQQQPQIHIDAEHRDDVWVFRVQDNGIGIAKQDQARVFEIFDRLHTQEEYEGTGIGLAVCKKIVERHGGRMWVESEVGEGSTFYFTLPEVEGEKTTAN